MKIFFTNLRHLLTKHEWITPVVLFLASFGIFTYQLGKESFWLDELYTIHASDTWEHFVATITWKEKNMWLYHTVMYFWKYLGNSEFTVRLLSVLFASLGVVAMYYLGKEYKNKKVGLLAATGLMLNTLYIAYAQEARAYSLMMLLFILSTLFFIRVIKNQTRRDILLYILCTGMAFYSHVFSSLFIGVQFMFLIWIYLKYKRNIFSLVKIFGGLGIFISPLIFFYIAANNAKVISHSQQALNWIPTPTLETLYNQYFLYASQSITLFLLYAALLLSLLISLFTKKVNEASTVSYLYTCAFVTVLFVYFFSCVVTPVFVPRYIIFSLPGYVLLGAISLSNIKNKYFFRAICVIVIVLSMKNIQFYFSTYHKEQWRNVVSFVSSHIGKHEKIIVTPQYLLLPFNYYIHDTRNKLSGTITSIPPLRYQDVADQQLNVEPNEVLGLLKGTKGVWVVSRRENLPKQRAIQTHNLKKSLITFYDDLPTEYDYKLLIVWHFEKKLYK